MVSKRAHKTDETREMIQELGSHIRHIESLRAGFLGLFLAALGLSFDSNGGAWKYLAIFLMGILGALYSLRVQSTLNVLQFNKRKYLSSELDPDNPRDVRKAGEGLNWVERIGGNIGVYVPTLSIYLLVYMPGIMWGILNFWCKTALYD